MAMAEYTAIDEQLSYDQSNELGRGAKSTVYGGMFSERSVAVKRIQCEDNKDAERTRLDINKLYREGNIMNKIEHLRHENIVGFYYSVASDKYLYLALELCQGTLKEYTENAKLQENFPPLKVNISMANGLDYLHLQNVVHRDLKPENVFFVTDALHIRKVVLGDFGTSKCTIDDTFSFTGAAGSMGYIPRELCEAMGRLEKNEKVTSKLSIKSDIFALGCLFYYTYTSGKHPFGTTFERQVNIMKESLPSLEQLEDYLQPNKELIEKMLSHNPEQRPNASEIVTHPALWTSEKIVSFFKYSSNTVQEMYKASAASVGMLEVNDVISNGDWISFLPPKLKESIWQRRKLYNGSSVVSLLRAVRNVETHLLQYSEDVQKELGTFPGGHAEFWMRLCPKLLMHVHRFFTGNVKSMPTKYQVASTTSASVQRNEDKHTESVQAHEETEEIDDKDEAPAVEQHATKQKEIESSVQQQAETEGLNDKGDEVAAPTIEHNEKKKTEIVSSIEQPTDMEEMNFNAKDADELHNIEDKDVSLRKYQTELAKEGLEGKNVIIMAPTNSGKTRVAFKIIQEHFRRFKRDNKVAKVIFLVEMETLAYQQGKACTELLSAYRTKVISGSSQRDKKQYLRDFVDRRDILVVTAQVLVNALLEKEIESLTKFSMIVFDECHHTNDQHPYNQIMRSYIALKLDTTMDKANLPQIVGLTASLGVGGNTQKVKAQEFMKKVMANLNASHLCTVRQHIEELKKYENPPYEEIVTANGRLDDVFRKTVNEALNKIDRFMSSQSKSAVSVPASRGTEKFIQWLSAFKESIAKLKSEDERRLLNRCRHHMEVYNKSLLIHKDARVKDAMKLVDAYMDDVQVNSKNDETDDELIRIYKDLKRVCFEDIPENPKLLKMQELLVNMIMPNKNARCIIFVKTRELAKALVAWMHETDAMKPLNATEFLGQNAPSSQGGMTKSRQQEALVYFKDGKHQVIIATSVAEEGLDITKCNLVIRYEHVTNEIVRLQSRGRARAPNSRYYVLTEVGSWIVEKEEQNAHLEKLMNQVIPGLQQHIEDENNKWEQEMRNIHEMNKIAETLKKKQRSSQMVDDAFKLECFNCSSFICMSSDVKIIQSCQHVVIDEVVNGKILSCQSDTPEFVENELKCGGITYCKHCMYKLGGVCTYMNADFPLFKISQFRVVDKHGNGKTYKKWKSVKFNVTPFTLGDLRSVAEKRLARL